ncbi:MAG: metal ABC transporter substrate-binding protein [Verrucomicrobiia bacterium]
MKITKSIITTLLISAITIHAAAAKLNVVASLPDLAAVAKEIGGERIKITSLANGNEDPHFVDPKPSFIRVLNQADVLIENGAELEAGWLPPLINNSRNPKITSYNSPNRIIGIEGVKLLDVPTARIDRSEGDVHPLGNPHYLLSPENCAIVASHIADSLSTIDPQGSDYYRKNLDLFKQKLESKIIEWRKMLEPLKGVRVITYHKSFDYFIEYFKLELAGTIETKPGIEPSPSHINSLIPQAKQMQVKLVVIEPNRPRKTPTQVASAIGAKLVICPLMPGGGNSPEDFFGFYDYVVKTIANSLKQ